MRKTTLRRFISGTLAVLSAAPLFAQECVYPASPNAIVVAQPNGQMISLHFRGRPPETWYEDENGLPVLCTAAGYVYARETASGKLAPTQWRVGGVDPRFVGIKAHVAVPMPARRHAKGASSSAGARGTFLMGSGLVKNLVLLLRFSNHGPSGQNRTLPSTSDVNTIMNAVDGHPLLAPSGSVRDHYLENSYGQFTIDSVANGWLTMPNTETYYANGDAGLTTRTWELITAGLDLADATVDFTQYDQDGDGWIDAITFLHSGYGAEWGGTDQYGTDYVDRIWSHKWEIPEWTSAEGVKVRDYNISPALWDTSGSAPGRIGVVCHELGHFFGLPDLYDTDGSSEGIGNWCLMAGGAWGFDGSQQYPSHMSAWAKVFLGWVTPQVILPGAQSVAQVELSPAVLRIDSGYPPGEYLLVENRQATGFDLMLPQSGLAIWHIDAGKGSLSENSPNNDEGYPGQSGWPGNANHYRNALLQADGDFNMENGDNRGDSGDVYHGAGATLLDNGTTPNTEGYQNGTILTTGNRIQSISSTGATMTFTCTNLSAPAIQVGPPPDGIQGTPYTYSLPSSGGSGIKTWSEFRDDPAYTLTDLGSGAFALGGVAQGWNADEQVWTLTLPFAFPFYERSYTQVYVSSNGFVDLAPTAAEFANRPDWLRGSLRIAPVWDDLRTDLGGQDIFVDTSIVGRVRIRWAAETYESGSPCSFALVLFSDGRIRFEYGSGNDDLTPTVGISRGHSADVLLPPTHDRQVSLGDASTLQFTLTGSQMPAGLSLSPEGLLSGTPTTPGTFQPRFRVTDDAFRYDQDVVSIAVAPDCNANGMADAQDIASASSADCDGNAVPDECDPDVDGDGSPNACDGCPNDPAKTAPGECGCGVADTDSDRDTFADCNDNCAAIANPLQEDCDRDGIGDVCEFAAGTHHDLNANGLPDECEGPVISFCFGDGSSTSCPCGNSVVPGSGQGCQNSSGVGALLSAARAAQPNTMRLTCTGVSPNQLCVVLESVASATPASIVGDGIGCLGASSVQQRLLKRFAVGTTVSFGVRAALPGQARVYQVSYRDPAALFCTPATTNRSNALQITW